MKPAEGSTVIGKSVIIRGELSGQEDLYIDGDVEGTVTLPESRLTIGPNAQVRADCQREGSRHIRQSHRKYLLFGPRRSPPVRRRERRHSCRQALHRRKRHLNRTRGTEERLGNGRAFSAGPCPCASLSYRRQLRLMRLFSHNPRHKPEREAGGCLAVSAVVIVREFPWKCIGPRASTLQRME